jgi:O-antigen/teichoic acid export membrane protein
MLEFLSRILRRRRVVTERDLAYARRYNLLADAPQADNTYNRLIGYIPADAIAIYLMGVGLLGGPVMNVPGTANATQIASGVQLERLWILFAVTSILAPALAFVGTLRHADNWCHRVQWFQVLSAPLAFTAWAFAVGGPFASLSIWAPQVGAFVLLVASVIITGLDKLIDFIAKEKAGGSKSSV